MEWGVRSGPRSGDSPADHMRPKNGRNRLQGQFAWRNEPWRLGCESEERHARQFREFGRKLILKVGVGRCAGRGLRSAMVPVAAADGRRGFIAHCEPCLCQMALLEIVWRSRTAHLRRDPARVNGATQDVRPAPGDREGEGGHIELAVWYAWLASQRRSTQSMSRSALAPPRCIPLLR